MDGISSANYNNNSCNWNQLRGGENTENVRQLLVHLDRERQNAETQNQVNEAKLARLKELVFAMRRERDEAIQQRDEAVEQLLILRHQISQQTYMNSKPPIGSSPLGLDAIPVDQSSSRSLLVDEQNWDWPSDEHDDFHQPAAAPSFIDHNVGGSNLAEKETVFEHPDDDQQDISNFLTQHDPEQQQVEQVDDSSLQRLVEDSMTGLHDLWQQQHAGVTQTSETHMVGISEAACRPRGHGHMAYSNQAGQMIDSNRSSVPAMPFHLPEPPEADPAIMLSTLPERGKLMQAVADAGPLLETLLVTGYVPRWRHPPPPPAMDALEMPVFSIRSPASPPLVQLGHMQPYQSHASCSVLTTSSPSPPLHLGHMQLMHNSPTADHPLHAVTTSASSSADASIRIKETHAFSSPTSKLICCPVINSHDSAFTGPPLKFAKIH
ncbi:hypothetical protein KI387_006465 [Taxus chinensis]|uniref:Uncharacterized protein n=1 Tax=Taxus chinensis TaxID=29808 RepID=A0AA38LLZ0_TAXCH|nr:hypothetical protein KI387_006465 [Taxus chinensis]